MYPLRLLSPAFHSEPKVLSFEATEQVNDLGTVRVNVQVPLGEAHGLNRRALASRVKLVVQLGDGTAARSCRVFSGIVTELRGGTASGGLVEVTLTIRPALVLLGYRTSRRVFEDMTSQEILELLLAPTGIRFEWRAAHPGPRRNLRVQYDESDLAFIVRLLAEEHLSWYVAADTAQRAVSAWESSERMIVGGSFGTESPCDARVARSSSRASAFGSSARTYALDEAVAALEATTNDLRFEVGARVHVDSPIEPDLMPYVVHRLDHHGSVTSASSHLNVWSYVRAVPAGARLEAPLKERPRLPSFHAARVVAADGARVRVAFPWPRDGSSERACCWMPLVQAPGRRVPELAQGAHIFVAFVEGDPERPIAFAGLGWPNGSDGCKGTEKSPAPGRS